MLVSLKEIITNAFQKGYAVGAFNCLSLENVMGGSTSRGRVEIANYSAINRSAIPLRSDGDNDPYVCGCGS